MVRPKRLRQHAEIVGSPRVVVATARVERPAALLGVHVHHGGNLVRFALVGRELRGTWDVCPGYHSCTHLKTGRRCRSRLVRRLLPHRTQHPLVDGSACYFFVGTNVDLHLRPEIRMGSTNVLQCPWSGFRRTPILSGAPATRGTEHFHQLHHMFGFFSVNLDLLPVLVVFARALLLVRYPGLRAVNCFPVGLLGA